MSEVGRHEALWLLLLRKTCLYAEIKKKEHKFVDGTLFQELCWKGHVIFGQYK